MISPIIAAQNSTPIANVQQNTETQGVLQNQMAHVKNQENQRQIRESVIKKDEAVFYQPRHDAKEEGKNKYVNLYEKKKKKQESTDETESKATTRINFDIKI